MHPKVYLLTELRRVFNYYNIRYTYTGKKGIYINRGQIIPALKFEFDEVNFYVQIKHLLENDFDPINWKYTYDLPVSITLVQLFTKLLKFNLIDNGIFTSIQRFERARNSK